MNRGVIEKFCKENNGIFKVVEDKKGITHSGKITRNIIVGKYELNGLMYHFTLDDMGGIGMGGGHKIWIEHESFYHKELSIYPKSFFDLILDFKNFISSRKVLRTRIGNHQLEGEIRIINSIKEDEEIVSYMKADKLSMRIEGKRIILSPSFGIQKIEQLISYSNLICQFLKKIKTVPNIV